MPKIVIETDGDPKNTKLTIDGKKITKLSNLSVYADLKCWCDSDPCWCTYVDFSYVTEKVDSKNDMKVRTRYSLDRSTASFIEEDDIDTKNMTAEQFSKM